MPRALRTAALIALAVAIPVGVASATYAIGVRSLAPTTRLQVNVANQAPGDSPSPGRTSDDHGGSTAGHDGGTDDHGGTSKGTSGGTGSTSGAGSSSSGDDRHGGSSGSDDGGTSGSGGSGSDSGGGDD
jgi:hypothetical protein